MKRILALILAISLLLVCFVGCDKNDTNNGENTGNKGTAVNGPATVEYGAAAAETPLSNTYKLLHSGDKKLTIGYIGGSITFGRSATTALKGQTPGIQYSYVNRVSNWFKETYPNATIETVNAGVSDTATNFGVFRLEQTLMNTDGHDMPDLVFVEYTTNDWFYDTQTKEDLLIQIESLIRNIWELNPYAEIVFLSTQREFKNDSIKAYKEVAEKYNIPYIDVGGPLRSAIKEKAGKLKEESGTYYYTVDNLHPSVEGYKIYFDTIKPALEEKLKFELKDWKLYDYKANLAEPVYKNLITNPTIITADKLTVSGSAKSVQLPVTVGMYGTLLSVTNKSVTANCVDVTGKATITAKFNGATLGMLFNMKGGEKGFTLRYQIDGGEWQDFGVNSKEWDFQTYAHAQTFMFAHNLSDGEHTVNIEFLDGAETYFGGLLVNGK